MESLDDFWARFLKENKLPDTTPFGGELTYANDEQDFASVLALILCGKKTAQFSALAGYHIDNEPLPHKSEYYVLNNWKGEPVAVIKTINVEILPFEEVTWEMAQKEGADEDLNGFRSRYTEFFREDSDITGYDFSPEMPVVFEEFEVIWKSI
ncbi:MAG: ASCH domain-containing protein [Treponema sp.]|nr:ASCH domain-containing protein [Treponema sp.]